MYTYAYKAQSGIRQEDSGTLQINIISLSLYTYSMIIYDNRSSTSTMGTTQTHPTPTADIY